MLLKEDLNRIQQELTAYDTAREKVLEITRKATRLSGSAILQMHRSEYEQAETVLKQVRTLLSEIEELTTKGQWQKCRDIASIAYQEYTEAQLLLSLLTHAPLFSLREVEVNSFSYLLGLLDLIGELRRTTLNHLRKGDISKSEEVFETMEGLYEDLISLDHTAIIPNFRHKLDIARKIIEATRGDVVTEIRRWNLEQSIKGLQEKITDSGK